MRWPLWLRDAIRRSGPPPRDDRRRDNLAAQESSSPGTRWRYPFLERLAFEPLEDRRMLAIGLSGVPDWIEQGPGPLSNGQSLVLQNGSVIAGPSSGAVEALAANPFDADILFAATVNGGLWRTTDATAANPTWEPLTDKFPSLAMGAVAYSPLDATPLDHSDDVIYAAAGDFSSSRRSPVSTGVLKTTDGGDHWSLLGETELAGLPIRSVIPTRSFPQTAEEQVVLAASPFFDSQPGGKKGGVFRSVDGGNTWVRLSGSAGLPDSPATHLAADFDNRIPLPLPLVPDRIYAGVPGKVGSRTLTGAGVYRTIDDGQSWQDVSRGIPRDPRRLHSNRVVGEPGRQPSGLRDRDRK